jgi:hypothetical protein
MLVANYPFKKSLKSSIGEPLRYEETSLFGEEYRDDGYFTVVGPTAYERKWFASVIMKDGLIERVS